MKILTKKQQNNAVSALKKLVEMPEVKDLIVENLVIAEAKDGYKLLLTKQGIVKHREWSECVEVAYFSEDNRYENRVEDIKVTSKKFKEVIEFFDISAEEIIIFQNKLK